MTLPYNHSESVPMLAPRGYWCYLSGELTQADFERFCSDNEELRIERDENGKVLFMAPASLGSSEREAEFIADLKIYSRKHGGKSLSSSAGFTLPDSSVRSPDASYIRPEVADGISEDEWKKFAHVVPDFIVEVMSPSDELPVAKNKMVNTWIKNGVRLGWLVDVDADKLWIYRQDGSVSIVEPLNSIVTGEDVLPGFTFDLAILI